MFMFLLICVILGAINIIDVIIIPFPKWAISVLILCKGFKSGPLEV